MIHVITNLHDYGAIRRTKGVDHSKARDKIPREEIVIIKASQLGPRQKIGCCEYNIVAHILVL